MTKTSAAALARRAVLLAVLLGVLGDALLRTTWGIGFTFWALALVAAAAALVAWRDGIVRREVLGWLAVAAALALAFAWHDAEELQLLTVFAIVVALGLARIASVREPAATVFSASVSDVLFAALRFAVDLATGIVRLVFRDARPWRVAPDTAMPAARIFFVGVAALLAVVAFGALLAAADPVFAAWVDLLQFDFGEAIAHAAFATFVAWLVAGGLRGGVLPWELQGPAMAVPFRFGTLEVAMLLGSVTAVFVVFTAAQVAWIAGGAEFVRASTALTFAEFARRGFVQLIFVAALLLSLLLATRAVVATEDSRATAWYRRFAYVLIALLFITVWSAAMKLRLYVHFYGFSTARLYAAVAIAWLAIVFAWFTLTMLRGRPRRFAAGVFVSAFATLALLHAANPDLLVARYNLSHPPPRETRAEGIDFGYLASLSADAVPALVPRLLRERRRPAAATEEVPHGSPCLAAAAVYDRWYRNAPSADWRSWNASEARARRVVARHARELDAASCDVPRRLATER
jgi:hypothetical protein